ncbi:GntR family transcriptional regulator [Ligilactobacillus salivarius]|uniref:GntR family transcriptional regulator n=1 Tax=Ligilactobacillus salivarius TaxID=1624 RepID=UPI0013685B90|nr:GntR family transcriptional regulator [Ligilactobacillus salivarius]MYY56264.1 GntR family transcriptional regulator [Ligilactobacillus salivarius]
MLHFNFNSTEPIYLQVANQLEEAIFTKAFLDGTQVPSTTEISKEFHINPATVLKGMNILVNDGLLEKRRGLGMFVTEDAYMKLLERRKESFYQDYIVKMIQEAKKLGMNEDDLIELVKRGVD